MFFRKLFKVGDKVKWILLELLVVFVGVYMAFLFQQYAEDQKLKQEKDKVLMSLKAELDDFRSSFPRYAHSQENKNQEWDSLFAAQEVGDFYGWRYLEPQYNYKIIEYALNQEGTDVVSFELYDELSQLHSFIKRLEHAERMMTEHGQWYRNISQSWNKESMEYKERNADNRFNFFKFIIAAKDRAGNLRRIAEMSEAIVRTVNDELGPEKAKVAEIKMIHRYLEAEIDEDFIKEVFLEYFPNYTEGELDSIIQEWKQESSPQSK